MRISHPLIRISGTAMLAMASLAMAACSGMTQQEKNTAIGAGVGAIGGSILTGGSTTGTLVEVVPAQALRALEQCMLDLRFVVDSMDAQGEPVTTRLARLRQFVLLALLFNLVYFLWAEDLLRGAGFGPKVQREPLRLERQINPQAVKIQKIDLQFPGDAALASSEGPCLQSDPLEQGKASLLRQSVSPLLPSNCGFEVAGSAAHGVAQGRAGVGRAEQALPAAEHGERTEHHAHGGKDLHASAGCHVAIS